MIIETKYNIGDEVWFGSLGFDKHATVCAIKITVLIDGYIIIEYDLHHAGYHWTRNEHEIFKTKEELLKSL